MFFDEAIRRVKMLFRGKQFQDDLDEEMRLHREFREKKYVDSGMSPEAARSAAGDARSGSAVCYRQPLVDNTGHDLAPPSIRRHTLRDDAYVSSLVQRQASRSKDTSGKDFFRRRRQQ